MYLRNRLFIGGLILILLNAVFLAQEKDLSGSKDHPLLSRLENYYISDYEEFDFESHEFYDAEDKEFSIEGRKWVIDYTLKEGFKSPVQTKVRKNYINAIKEIGGTILFDRGLYMKYVSENTEYWIEVWISSSGEDYRLTIVERTVMGQEVKADPDAMADDIKKMGHVAVYGIYFDFDSAKIKAESEPMMNAIAELLKTHSSLKVYIVGHTDMTGKLDYNMDLSLRRAQAVVKELNDKYGIKASRLQPKGVGPLCPVSTNRTEAGQKLNRRVELVEMDIF